MKGIAGFYYVQVAGSGVYECKARGIFRKEGQKPLVGDYVEMSVLDEAEREGSIDVILPRKNALVRPAVANVDQALVIFAAAKPKPNLNLLDRFLVSMRRQNVDTLICFNKQDIVGEPECERLRQIYENCGCRILQSSAVSGAGVAELRRALQDKTTTVAGPSGVGKSSLVNRLAPEARMETGEISRKVDRGKHTTRHSQLIMLDDTSFLCDTPGFSSLSVWDMEKEELKDCFPEFASREGCRFLGCSHTREPDCAVRRAVEEGLISRQRYENYLEMYEELKNKRKY